MYTTSAPALTYVRAGALVPPPPCLGLGATRVGPGQYPQYTRADFGKEAVGGSLHPRPQKTVTRQPTSPTHSTRLTSRAVLPLFIFSFFRFFFLFFLFFFFIFPLLPPPPPPPPTGPLPVLRTSRKTLSSSLPLLPGRCTVVSAFKNPDSWLKSLSQRKETGVPRRRE